MHPVAHAEALAVGADAGGLVGHGLFRTAAAVAPAPQEPLDEDVSRDFEGRKVIGHELRPGIAGPGVARNGNLAQSGDLPRHERTALVVEDDLELRIHRQQFGSYLFDGFRGEFFLVEPVGGKFGIVEFDGDLLSGACPVKRPALVAETAAEGAHGVEKEAVHVIRFRHFLHHGQKVFVEIAGVKAQVPEVFRNKETPARGGTHEPLRVSAARFAVHAQIDVGDGGHVPLVELRRHDARQIDLKFRVRDPLPGGVKTESRVVLAEDHRFGYSQLVCLFHRFGDGGSRSDPGTGPALHSVTPCGFGDLHLRFLFVSGA